MLDSMLDSETRNASGGVLRSMRAPKAVVAVTVAFGFLLTACSSSSSSTTSTTASVRAVYLDKSGAGSKSIPAVSLPAKWTAAWRFICDQAPGAKSSFVLTAMDHGRSPTVVTNQTGLGGGGQKPYTKSGSYSFQIKTSCTWKLSVKPTPKTASSPKAASSPKVTAAPTTTTTKAG